jgi:1,4-dihydroxy-2-naphthoyl-CoA hydrolase
MGIWTREISLDAVNERCQGSLIGHIGIEVVEIGDDFLKARMPVDARTKQPAGVLHGGASVVLAETLASWAATFSVDSTRHHCVGLEINANHVRPASSGFVYGTARPVHLGRSTHIWEVRVTNEDDKLVCVSRVTMAVLDVPNRYGGS